MQVMANLLSTGLQRNAAELERQELLEQAQRAVVARDRAVSIVSHDLRTPLSTIDMCAGALLDPDAPSLDGVRHMAHMIHQCTAWTQQIVQDLLDRASLDSGTLALKREPTVVADVLDVAQGMFTPMTEERSLELVVDKGLDLPLIDADPRRLLQVLSNLLSNAVKFTPAGGTVILSAKRTADDPSTGRRAGQRDAVRFAVRDTGPGMPSEDVAHIFEWFWHSPRNGSGGTGLGLAIAKGLIEAHHGSLKVESAPGQGSTFWFTVPASMPQLPPPAVSPSPLVTGPAALPPA
jgi:signal transduction histidine kinase